MGLKHGAFSVIVKSSRRFVASSGVMSTRGVSLCLATSSPAPAPAPARHNLDNMGKETSELPVVAEWSTAAHHALTQTLCRAHLTFTVYATLCQSIYYPSCILSKKCRYSIIISGHLDLSPPVTPVGSSVLPLPHFGIFELGGEPLQYDMWRHPCCACLPMGFSWSLL